MADHNKGRRFDPQQRKYIVQEALGKMKFVQDAKSKLNDPMEKLMHSVADIITDVHRHVRPIVKAGGAFDTAALKQIIFTTTQESIYKLSKDELEILVIIQIADCVFDDIMRAPGGGDKPDLLSGS